MRFSMGVALLIMVFLLFVPEAALAQYSVLWTASGGAVYPGYTDVTPSFIGDMDGDGQMEICIRTSSVFEIRDGMTGAMEFTHDFGNTVETLWVIDLDGNGALEAVLKIDNGNVAVVGYSGGATAVSSDPGPELRDVHSLNQAYPNPFNAGTTIPLSLRSHGHAELRIFDAAGRLVRRLVNKPMDPGSHNVEWDGLSDGGSTVASGVYFYELRIDGQVVGSQKAVVLK